MAVTFVTIDQDSAGQRVDNYLLNHCKGLPRTRLYRAIRKGEVRVNKGRIKADYRLQTGDELRIPPFHVETRQPANQASPRLIQELEASIIYEDNNLIVINKPSGLPVHGGTEISAGLIETLRVMRPKAKRLELVHRLDRETSGCLLIAKKRSVLVELHELLTHRKVQKTYLTLVKGRWTGGERMVTAPLRKNCLSSGERVVRVDPENGKPSKTSFRPIAQFADATLLLAKLYTGRTHQIRVHAAHTGHPIVGDRKYGDEEFNKQLRRLGLRRMFLHSACLSFQLSESCQLALDLGACMDRQLLSVLRRIN